MGPQQITTLGLRKPTSSTEIRCTFGSLMPRPLERRQKWEFSVLRMQLRLGILPLMQAAWVTSLLTAPILVLLQPSRRLETWVAQAFLEPSAQQHLAQPWLLSLLASCFSASGHWGLSSVAAAHRGSLIYFFFEKGVVHSRSLFLYAEADGVNSQNGSSAAFRMRLMGGGNGTQWPIQPMKDQQTITR